MRPIGPKTVGSFVLLSFSGTTNAGAGWNGLLAATIIM